MQDDGCFSFEGPAETAQQEGRRHMQMQVTMEQWKGNGARPDFKKQQQQSDCSQSKENE